jgi:pimeloyl-ACP methyl ester carboxylesterase
MELEVTTPNPRPDWLSPTMWPWPLATLDVDGRRLVYSDTGGDGPPLLLIRVGLWSLLWNGMIAHLGDRYRCITLDVPGSGLADGGPASLVVATDAIGALIDHLRLDDATLVVHDTGGLATFAALGRLPERAAGIAGLVAINTFGWAPRGVLGLALRFFGSVLMRELNARLGLLAWGSGTMFGVGRHWDAPPNALGGAGCPHVPDADSCTTCSPKQRGIARSRLLPKTGLPCLPTGRRSPFSGSSATTSSSSGAGAGCAQR